MNPGADLAAVLFAGGRSTRMGMDKAFLSWGGARLIDRQLTLLRTLQPDELIISGREGVAYGTPPEVLVVVDREPGLGPLAGLCAAFAATRSPHLLVLAVDMPLMTGELLAELAGRRRAGCGVVVRFSGGPEPLAAVYPRSMQMRAEAALRGGCLALRELIAQALVAGELDEWVPGEEQARAFANWNAPGDLP